MVLWDDIYTSLIKQGVSGYDIDVRYLGKWIKEFPNLFPIFVISGNYRIHFDWEQLKWYIYEGVQ